MSSSTSSSDRPPEEAPTAPAVRRPRLRIVDRRVLLGVLAVFALLEVFTRVRLFDMSKDFRRFRGYDARAERLMAAPAPRIGLIGNSATDRGVDVATLEKALAAAGHPAHADLFVADQSRINTWRFVMEKHFARPQRRPELLVMTFYEDDLADGNPVEVGRLAQFFTSPRDWPEVFTTHLTTVGERVDFVLSSGWATYAASERIRERLLAALVPGFADYSERANQIVFDHQKRRAGGARPAAASAAPRRYEALQRTLARAREAGIRLCFVAYPTLVPGGGLPYELPAEVPDLLRAAGVGFLDLRRVPTLRPDLYADEVHLNEQGKIPYSAALGTALAGELARLGL